MLTERQSAVAPISPFPPGEPATRAWLSLRTLAVLASVVSVAAVLGIGLVVAHLAWTDLLRARTVIHQGVVEELIRQGLLPLDPADPAQLEALDEAVRLRLIGGEAIRVKLWTDDGVIAYSDEASLIGLRFPVSEHVAEALAGNAGVEVGDLSADENVAERHLGSFLEFYLPVRVDGRVAGVFEVYEESSTFRATIDEIRGHVWVAVVSGLVALSIAFGSVVMSYSRSLNRRRREAEVLLGQVLTAGDDERRRIVGALHDEIGQPLYRVSAGLETSLDRSTDPEVALELIRLQSLVKAIDSALRSELQVLHSGLVEGDGLVEALDRLARATRQESGIEVVVRAGAVDDLPSTVATVLFRVAQEAMINARKHANPSRIVIEVGTSAARARLQVVDNGRGWDGRVGLGLTTARERLAAIDGRLDVARRAGGQGTVVTAEVPNQREKVRV